MTKVLFAAMVSAGLAYAPAAMAQATPMDKGMMKKDDKMMMDKKDSMAKPAMDDKKMMDKKDSMAKPAMDDKMKK